MLADDRQTYASLLEARPRPSVLDDATIARTKRVSTEQRDDLGRYEEQLARWSRLALTPARRREVARLTAQLGRVREVVAAILALAAELGLATLLGRIPLPGPPPRRR
jgi:hypothetical protein